MVWQSLQELYGKEMERDNLRLETIERVDKPRVPKEYSQLWDMREFFSRLGESLRLEEKKAITSAWINWQNGRGSTVAVRNYLGEGCSLSFNTWQKMWGPGEALRIVFSQKVLEEVRLMELLQPAMSPNSKDLKVVLVDNCHHLFLKEVGGFSALRTFLQIISSTNDRLFWITSWGQHGWYYLDNIMGISELFTSVIPFKTFSSEQLEEIFTSECTNNGYQVEVEEDFFDKMTAEVGGRINPSLFYWHAASYLTGEDQIIVKDFKPVELDWLDEADEEQIYALVALLEGEGLTAGQLAKVINRNYTWCRLFLNQACIKKISFTYKEVYYLSPLVLTGVARALSKRRLVAFKE